MLDDILMDFVAPIFIISLPRSGSTLTQKILTSHPGIASTAEPWVMLPFIYALKNQNDGIYTEYQHGLASTGIKDFIQELPAGMSDYYAAVREMATRLYAAATRGKASYFLDKTPRYQLIIDELMEIFPDAKFIFLWRNPLAIAASLLNSIGTKGRWDLYRYKIDLYKGIEMLIEAATSYSDRIIQIHYEDMVSNPSMVWRDVFSYLGLDYEPSILEDYAGVKFSGAMVGPPGAKAYDKISTQSIDSWTDAFRSPLRRAWARRYLAWIGDDRLQVMGYAREDILRTLHGSLDFNPARAISDAAFMTIGAAHAAFDLSGVKRQLRIAISGKRCYPAT
jgi:Sulfotransferase family